MDIIEVDFGIKQKLIYALPDKNILYKSSVLLAWNPKTDIYVILKNRYKLKQIDITKLNYEILNNSISYNNINKLSNEISGKNIIITPSVLKTEEAKSILLSI